jgi:integrase
MDWPKGIKPRGRGLEITIWQGGRRAYNEIVACDPYSKADLASAVRKRDDLKARLRAGLPLRKEAAGTQVFADVAQRYLNSLQISHGEIKLQTRYLNNYWMPIFGNRLVTDITGAEIREALAGMGVKFKTQQNRLQPLRGVLDHAGVNPNPAKGITWPRSKRKSQKERVERYRPTDRATLIEHLDKLANRHPEGTKGHWTAQARVYFPLLFATGLRPGEALGLDWTDYDGEFLNVETQRSDSQERDTTKTGERRTVYVPTWVRPRLDNHPTRFAGGAIFTGVKGGALAYTDELNSIWQEAHQKARIRYRRPYVCRHTRAAELLSNGVTPAEGAQELGHSVQMFLQTYAEFIEEYRGARDYSRFEAHADAENRRGPVNAG